VTAWPRTVWDSAWLRGLDPPGREQIEAAGSLRALDAGATLYRAGDAADAFFVVADGLVDVSAVRRGDGDASVIRRATVGEAVGEDAIVRVGATRSAAATCASRATVAGVPVSVFRRATERVGSDHAHRLDRALRAAAARDVFRASSLQRAMSARALDALVEAIDHRILGRGDVLFAQGDPATHAYVIADGMVQVLTEDDGRARICAYLSRGDLVVDGSLEGSGPHEVTVSACGPAWIVAIPRARLLDIASGSRALLLMGRLSASPPLPEATRHVLGDLWRFAAAGSMLVIDDEACARCGHCAWSCSRAHDDGVSRLLLRGDKVRVRDAASGESRAFVLPGSCQHCKHPACMVDCPTGAIGRDPRGEVFIRETLCIGCEQCVKACPWGSVQMAPRVAGRTVALPLASSRRVAVKCDACRDVEGGPACVSACPVDAIARVEPLAAMAEVRDAVVAPGPSRRLPQRRAAWPWLVGSVPVTAAMAAAHWTPMVSGVLSGLLCSLLAGYAIVKRVRPRRSGGSGRSRVRPHAIAHLALGVLAVGAVVAHAGASVPPNAAGALLVAFAIASMTGIAMALAYRMVPGALARIERFARLPEDLPNRARELEERAFGVLTGRSDEAKSVYQHMLAPYARRPLGPIFLLARGSAVRTEEERVRAWIERAVGAGVARLDGIDDLVRLVVERRAIGAQRVLQALLRAWLPAHVVAVAVALALLVVHVVCVARGR